MSSAKKFKFLLLKKIKLYDKNKLKKENNINKENAIFFKLVFKIISRLLNGKKPPEDIIVIERLRESKDLMSTKFNDKKIKIVKKKYKIKTLIDCLNDSKLLRDIKFVNDFLILSSNMSINKIIENKK